MKKEKVYKVNRPVNLYVPFTKMDEEKGIVYGYVTTPALDYDKQKIDMAAFAKALPEYLEYGNIREMHNRRAVGKVLNETVQMSDDGCFLGAKIIPKDVRELCDSGVYSGFSVGLADCLLKTEEGVPNGVITGDEMKIIEISLVDRPANPQARVTAYKVLGGKVETVLEKFTGKEYEEITPEKKEVTDKAQPEKVSKLTTFGAALQANEMLEELPKAMSLLWDVLSGIVYDPAATVEEKKGAMRQSVEEFADHMAGMLTGEKLSKTARPSAHDICVKAFGDLSEADYNSPELKLLATEISDKLGLYDKKELKPEPEIKPEPLADLTKQLQEAVSTIGKLQERLDKSEAVNKELTERVEKVEKSPAPPKAKVNQANLPGNGLPGGQPKTFEQLVEIKNKLATSGDPEARRAADIMGTLLFQAQYGGK